MEKAADADRKQKADRKAMVKQQKTALQAEKNKRVQEEAPLLGWLINKGFTAAGSKSITKKDMVRAFETHKAAIAKRVTDGGKTISKQTPMNAMKQMFIEYRVYEI